MLEQFFKDHAAAERLREGVLGPQLDTFAAVVSDLGYSPSTIRTQLQLLANLVRWIQENEVVISSIDENITDRFLTESGRKGALQRGQHSHTNVSPASKALPLTITDGDLEGKPVPGIACNTHTYGREKPSKQSRSHLK